MANTPIRSSAVGEGGGVGDTERPPSVDPPPALEGMGLPEAPGPTKIGPPPDPAAPIGTPRGLRAALAPLAPRTQPRPNATAAPRPPSAPSLPSSGPRSSQSDAVVGSVSRRCASCGELYPADFLVCPRDATPLVSEGETDTNADPLVGALIGETYQIVRVIGEGGMGRVYEARHLRLRERRFAVKCLHVELARNTEMAARFLREAETASSIKHANVVDVFDVHHLPDGTPYLVGEFLEGEELADYVMKRGPLEPRMAAKIARQVCQALSAAHVRGIVHRDMKPENVFVLKPSIDAVEQGLSRTLVVKVLDFGISKAGPSDKSHLTRTGVIMGTPSYMAPEQARGRPVDHRADIYSLGACLYFMVTGRRPFDSDDPTSTLSMVLTEDPVRPREIDPRIPEMVELVIQRAMAKDAGDRYASMAELDRALAQVTGQPNVAMPSGSLVPVHAQPLTPAPVPEQTGAARAFDVARALLVATPGPAQQNSSLARTARPAIALASGVLGAWLIGGGVAALAGLVRALHDGEVTLTEALLLVAGCLFAAATPIALYVMHLRRIVWPNSVRAVQLASDLKRVTLVALVTYGGISLVGRIVHTVFFRRSGGLASGFWDIALFVISIVATAMIGGVGPLLHSLRQRR